MGRRGLFRTPSLRYLRIVLKSMQQCPQISKPGKKFLAVLSLTLSCFAGCWEEIRYKQGQYEQTAAKVQKQASMAVNDQVPPEPSNVSSRVEPPEEAATEVPEQPQSAPTPEPIASKPKRIESEPEEPRDFEPKSESEAEFERELESRDDPEEDADRPEKVVLEAASSPMQTDLVDPPVTDAAAWVAVPATAPPNEPPGQQTEQLSEAASETAEAASEDPQVKEAESSQADMSSSDSEQEVVGDDPFAFFDSEEPQVEVEKNQAAVTADAVSNADEEDATGETNQESQPKAKTELDVNEEIDLLFGERPPATKPVTAKPAPAKPFETQPAPPLPIVPPEESETEESKTEEQDTTKAQQPDEPLESEQVPDEAATVDASDQAAPEVETQAPESQPELPEPQAEKKDISILVQPKKSVDRANVWRAASRWSIALALHAKGMKPKSYQSAWKSAETAAETLTLKLPLIPKIGEDQDPVATVQVAMIEAEGPDLWQAIESEHGIPAGDLAELAVRTHRMLLTYSPTKPHFANEAVELTRLAESAELPSSLWQPLVKLMEAQGSYKEVKRAIFQMHKNVAQHYSAK